MELDFRALGPTSIKTINMLIIIMFILPARPGSVLLADHKWVYKAWPWPNTRYPGLYLKPARPGHFKWHHGPDTIMGMTYLRTCNSYARVIPWENFYILSPLKLSSRILKFSVVGTCNIFSWDLLSSSTLWLLLPLPRLLVFILSAAALKLPQILVSCFWLHVALPSTIQHWVYYS